ncbi:MAG: SDR family oxidoreductase [Bryobacteraceae bacterium]|nr:SDR family oxidoreductase [Bryobacteraceae bacterium]
MSVSLKNQVALVVGASSGIGYSSAVLLARDGAKVMASARRAGRLEELKAKLTAEGCEIDVFAADAGKADDMEKLAAATRARFGKVDILVYATGTNTPDRALTRLNNSIWHELVQVNLNGAYYITQALLPAMRDAKAGHLIYVSSISGKVPDVSGVAYQASKRGMLGLSHGIRVEEKENGIRTCVICPGLVDSELMEKRPVKPTAETLAKALQPDDVGEVVLAVAKLHPRVTVPELEILPTVL